MRTLLLVVITVMALGILAAPGLCGKPDDGSTAVAPVDGALSERWFAFKNTHDIVNIAKQELVANALVDEEVGYGKELKGAYAIEPVFVESLDTQYPSYYMVSFIGKEQKISVLCIMGVKDGKTSLTEVYGLNPNITTAVYPPVIEEEARGIAAAHGKAVGKNKAKLVFKFSEECGGPAMPAWDFGNGVRVSQNGKVFSDFAPEGKLKKD